MGNSPKTQPRLSGVRNERVANTREEPIVVPVIVVLVHVHLALVIPAVERRVAMCEIPSMAPPVDNLRAE